MTNSNLRAEQESLSSGNKRKRKFWLWGCGGGIIIICLLIGGVAGYVFYESSRPFPLAGKISLPLTVKQNNEFDFVITLTNSTTKSIFIKHIVFFRIVDAPFLLEGARVNSVEPDMISEPLNSRDVKYSYFREIKPDETQTVTFHMLAENTGTYDLNIGVYAKDPSRPDPAFIQAFHFTGAKIEITP
jgi:hypothetical protein